MIGIPVLDSLSTDQLADIANGYKVIRIPKPAPMQLSLDPHAEPTPTTFEEIPSDTIITLCRMEIESRMGWAWLAKQIEERKNE